MYMSNISGVVVTGVSGKMGQMLVKLIQSNEHLKLVGVTERKGHHWIGSDLGVLLGGPASEIIVSDSLLDLMPEAKVIIDFTSPMATVEHSELAAQARVAHIIGTTGMNLKDLEKIKMAARHAPIVRAGNMSLGVNLLMELTQKISAALDDDFDIEIIESHHRAQVDAPSGTALMLGQAAALGRGISLETDSERGRDGITGERGKGKIGFSSIRGGDVVGEHDVVFAADGERIVLRHIASDRAIFARGALKAALWALGKPPGEYSMLNVLGLD